MVRSVFLLALVLAVLVASASALSVLSDPNVHRAPASGSQHVLDEEALQRLAFKDFVYKHGKTYASEAEAEKRFTIFKQNLAKIDELNSRGSHATFGVTKFADLTREEFKQAYLSPMGYPATHHAGAPVAPLLSKDVVSSIPSSWDWRTHGAVTPVKNQGGCGSCWAFSTTGNVEGQWFLAGHQLTGLSEQNLVDCDHKCRIYENQQSCDSGCGGGLQPNAFTYIIDNGGIDTESSYPYEGYDDTCRYTAANRGAQITNWTFISQNEDQMAAQLVQRGPLAIAASAVEWQFYLFGVFDYPCGTELDHGILIVGYGEETDDFGFNIKYWIVKNSWGQDWGVESGYILLQRGVGECGLNLYVSSAIITK